MLKRTLILLAVALSQWGCDINYRGNLSPFKPWNLEEVRSRLEQEKQDFLKIEDLEVGKVPIASWGRRLKAEIEVRYADDGTTMYKGPIVTYVGFEGLLATYLPDRFMLRTANPEFNWGSMVWLSVDGDASRSAQNWFVAERLPAAICSALSASS